MVLELFEFGDTINAVASRHGVLPKNLVNWKKQFLEKWSLAFDKKQVVSSYEESIFSLKREKNQVARKLGKVDVGRDWLSEKLKSFDLSSIKKFSNDSEVVEAQSKLKKPTLCRRFGLLAVIKQ